MFGISCFTFSQFAFIYGLQLVESELLLQKNALLRLLWRYTCRRNSLRINLRILQK